MSPHVALPRKWHFNAAVHVMFNVGQRYNSRLVYDPSYPLIDHSVFTKHDWSEFYRDANEKSRRLSHHRAKEEFMIFNMVLPIEKVEVQ